MKILIDIKDSKVNFFLELLKNFNFIKSHKIMDEQEYDPEFVEKIEQGQKDIDQGKGISLTIDDLNDLCK